MADSDLRIDADAFVRLDSYIQKDIQDGRNFGASLLVARSGEVVHRRTFGTVAPGRAAADDDRYLLMSMSKAFTATMVLKAVDEGRFQLDTRVADLVPGFGVAGKQNATVRQLLIHTSGLPFGLVPPPLGLEKAGDLAAKSTAICAIPAAYEPGTRCLYTSGLGFDLSGQILVNTDPHGRGFRQIMAEDLFAPLGMSDTSFGLPVNDSRRVPVSFTEKNFGPTSAALAHLFNSIMGETAEIPSGNAYSTIDDLLKFTNVIRGRGTARDQRVLSPSLFEYARRNHTGKLVNDALTAEVLARGLGQYPANFTMLGSYVRGEEHMLTPVGQTASPSSLAAVGGASTGFMVDFERDVTVIFLSAGFIEGLRHFERLQHINDLALAAFDFRES
ncbi:MULTISPECIES: serine hydrolase [unclassified Burkholderia]|uniref:serine hydrolase domain-containing protein n=1 Tax=unclassified Burkholderia TaxID=2613784 RepID=UPI000F562C16|nr:MULTISPECIES: serine hydrolase domain-containing protein [unclassified Burkholderia]RQR70959.1 class A beta-lactamase-related serine hydrolase [Burkholderia sp. Bp9011]RQR83722.1 class A beta-lactamase-related serine hydrolase [Burkholderia sp. Bp9010]RQS64423.1 class A beta-lactamase-related serine hydrolase [Burkholderia sp. Bp8977]